MGVARWITAALLLGSSLLAATTTDAAQLPGPCSLISDDALSQALGSPSHAMGLLSNAATSALSAAVGDMCVVQMTGGNALVIVHMVGVTSPGDIGAAFALGQAGSGGLGSGVDPSVLTTTPISGLGDSAVLLSGNPNGQAYAQLLVWRGSEGYSLMSNGLSDPQTTLTSIAQTILAAAPAQ